MSNKGASDCFFPSNVPTALSFITDLYFIIITIGAVILFTALVNKPVIDAIEKTNPDELFEKLDEERRLLNAYIGLGIFFIIIGIMLWILHRAMFSGNSSTCK